MDIDWWKDAVIYQIYPRSFFDHSGDGMGDLQGIIDKLDYLSSLGVDALWISPFYPSPAFDGGYDVSEYCDIDPVFGTMADFDQLLEESHSRGLKVIIDLVPNHTSWSHAWFKEALGDSPGSRARSRYVFRYSQNPPNNWGSMFGGSAWSRVQELTGKAEDRDWWYLHLFSSQQPDLNWGNPDVQEFFLDILRFWLDKGVDGFRVDVAHGLIKNPAFPDDKLGLERWEYADANGPYSNQPYYDQDRVHEIYRSWRHLCNRYNPPRMMVGEVWVRPRERASAYARPDEMHQVFNFDFLHCPFDYRLLRQIITESLRVDGAVGAPSTWVLANHDQLRARTRLGYPAGAMLERGIGAGDPQPDWEIGLLRARAALLLMLALPGSAYIFQGEELGLPDFTMMDDAARRDPTWERTNHQVRGRDSSRVPLPWSTGRPNYGFSDAKPWLPQPSDWDDLTVENQEKDADSTLCLYRESLRLRKEWQLGSGSLTWDNAPTRVLAFHNGQLHCWVNTSILPVNLPPGSQVILSSTGHPESPDAVNCSVGDSATSGSSPVLEPNVTMWFTRVDK